MGERNNWHLGAYLQQVYYVFITIAETL